MKGTNQDEGIYTLQGPPLSFSYIPDKDMFGIYLVYTIFVRAERSGKGDGRVYTLNYMVTDVSGNTATASTTVTVPHDQGHTAVDSGVRYIVTP